MRLRSHIGVLLLGGLLTAGLAPVPAAWAAPAAEAVAEVSRLEAECARLRTELQRANADVAALKRGERGVRNDYWLRQRMADAEALARKLTDAEAQLRARTGRAAPVPQAPTLAPPSAEPGDGPVELEAKADLLSDQARRLSAQAQDLVRRAGELRGRQLLRKRAFQLERDPFSTMEGSKRSMVFGGSTRSGSKGGDESAPKSPQPTGGNGSMDTATRGGGAGGSSGSGAPVAGGGAPMPTTGSTPPPPTAQPGAAPPSTSGPAPATPPPTQTPGDAVKGAEFAAPQPTSALSTQLRTLLDPATLSEVQRLERTGKPISDPEAIEKLAAALRLRAQSLEAQSKSLRAKARP